MGGTPGGPPAPGARSSSISNSDTWGRCRRLPDWLHTREECRRRAWSLLPTYALVYCSTYARICTAIHKRVYIAVHIAGNDVVSLPTIPNLNLDSDPIQVNRIAIIRPYIMFIIDCPHQCALVMW